MTLNETHDPDLESWVESANAPDSDFPIQNLPFCVFRHGGNAPHVGVGIGDQIMDVADAPSLNALMADGRAACSGLRLMARSEEHTSELQSRENLVCRLLLEKKKKK